MKENEELYDYSKYILVPQDNEDIKNLREAIETITEDLNNFVGEHKKDESQEIKDKVAEYDHLYDMLSGVQFVIDDFDPERIEIMLPERLDDELQELHNFKTYAEGGKGISNFRKFLDYVKTLENGDQLAADFVKGFKALNENQKLGMDIDKLMAENNISENEIEEERKKKEVQDGIGHLFQEEKQKEFADMAANRNPEGNNYKIVNTDDELDEEDRMKERSLNEILSEGSIELTIPTEGSIAADDDFVEKRFRHRDPEDQTVAFGFALEEMYGDMLGDLCAFREEFSRAQLDKEANFGGAPEGPEDYQNFTKSLNECIDAMANRHESGITMGEIARKYDDVLQRAQKYTVEHKPRFTSHKTEESAKRYEIMGKLVDKGTVSVNTFNRLSSELKSNAKDLGLKDLSIKDIKCGEFKDILVNEYAPDGLSKKHYQELSAIKNNYRDEAAIEFLEKKVMKNIKKLTKNFKWIKVDDYYNNKIRAGYETNYDLFPKSVYNGYEYAAAYKIKCYLDKLKRTDNTSLDDLKDLVEKTSDPKRFTKEIGELSENETFKETMRLSPVNGLGYWQDAEEKAKNVGETTRERIESIENGTVQFPDPDKPINARLVANFLVGYLSAHPKDQEANKIYYLFSAFDSEELANSAARKAEKDIMDYLQKPNGLMSKIQGKTRAEITDILPLIKDPKLLDKAAEIQLKAAKETFKNNKKDFKLNEENKMIRRYGDKNGPQEVKKNSEPKKSDGPKMG